MKIATWNVNSIRAREERVRAWLEQHPVDVLCLQELKVQEEAFPWPTFEALGYHGAVWGQKTYNGVAIMARQALGEVVRGFLEGPADPQARLIGASVGELTVVSAYVPNGAEVGSEKYAYKIAWLRRLRKHLEQLTKPTQPLVVCGDFNVAPADHDVAHPERWRESVLCHQDAREALEEVRRWGLVDLFRQANPEARLYSWWDYRRLAFPKNEGLRLDMVYATAPIANRLARAWIDREARKGEKPSDHAPVVVELGP